MHCLIAKFEIKRYFLRVYSYIVIVYLGSENSLGRKRRYKSSGMLEAPRLWKVLGHRNDNNSC